MAKDSNGTRKQAQGSETAGRLTREEKLAAALRGNLLKRKQQSRARANSSGEESTGKS